MSDSRQALMGRLAQFQKYGPKLERALDVVLAGGVKEAVFLPSGRKVYSVVGRLGDEFIDPQRPYCSCSNFYFKVRGGKDELCYHLLSHRIATLLGKADVVKFDDDEYGDYLSATIRDVFDVLGKGGG
jgi:predicted nucleic acid-binding Zn finger protein